ncbi:MAG: hypothetical protein ACF8LK_07555 [Phycisphaerales bacterium JB041]
MTTGTPNPETPHSPNAPGLCPECDYSLAGLPPLSRESPCPECGYPAAHYVPPEHWLRHADPLWLRRVRLGLRLQEFVAYYVVASVLTFLALLVVSAILKYYEMPAPLSPDAPMWFEVILAVLWLLPIPAHSLGCWLSTKPVADSSTLTGHARKATRVLGTSLAPVMLSVMLLAIFIQAESPRWLKIARPLCFIAATGGYLFALASWCRALEWHTAAWTLQLPKRYRQLRKNLIGAVLLALFLGWSWMVLLLPNSPLHGKGKHMDTMELWWFWMFLGYAALVQLGITPAARALRSEIRHRRTEESSALDRSSEHQP